MPTIGSLGPVTYTRDAYNLDGSLYSKVISNPLVGLLGTRQSIEPAATGVFIPGRISVNPVIIRKETGWYDDVGFVRVKRIKDTRYYETYGNVGFRGKLPSLSVHAANLSQSKEAYIKAAAKCGSADFDAALFLAELSEAIAMVKDPLKGFISATRVYRRGKTALEKAKAAPDLLSDLWLTYIYGVKPLMSDIESAIEMYQKGIKKQFSYVPKRAKIEPKESVTVSYVRNHLVGDSLYDYEITLKQKQFSVACVYYQHILQSDLSWTLGQFGFSVKNIPALVWERVPYSFLVDWFIRVGDWLRVITPDPNYKFLASCTSQKTEITQITRTLQCRVADPYNFLIVGPKKTPTFTYKTETLQRFVNPESTGMFPVLNSSVLSITKQMTSAALLWGQAKNLFSKRG